MLRIVGLQTRYFLPVWLLLAVGVAALIRRALKPALTAEREGPGPAAVRLVRLCGGGAALSTLLCWTCLRHLSITTGGDLYCADLGLGGLFLLVLLAGAGAVLAALLDVSAALLPLPLLSAAALVLYRLACWAICALARRQLCCCWVLRWLWALSACARQVWERRWNRLTRPGFDCFWVVLRLSGACLPCTGPCLPSGTSSPPEALRPKWWWARRVFMWPIRQPERSQLYLPATSLVTFLFQPFGSWAEWACLAALDTLALKRCVAAASALPRPQWAGASLCSGPGLCCRSSSPIIRRAAMRRSMPTPWRTCRWRCCLAGHSACIILWGIAGGHSG